MSPEEYRRKLAFVVQLAGEYLITARSCGADHMPYQRAIDTAETLMKVAKAPLTRANEEKIRTFLGLDMGVVVQSYQEVT